MPSLPTLDRHFFAHPVAWAIYAALLVIVGIITFADSLALPVRLSTSGLSTLAGHPQLARGLTLALHILASLLLAFTGFRFGTGPLAAALGGFFFLINVAHFDVLYTGSSFAHPLALLGLLSALLFLKPYIDSGNWYWLLPCSVCLLASIILLPLTALMMPVGLYLLMARAPLAKSLDIRLVLISSLALVVAVAFVWSRFGEFPVVTPLSAAELQIWIWSRLLTTAHWAFMPLFVPPRFELFVGLLIFVALLLATLRGQGPVALWGLWTLLSVPPLPLAAATMTALREGFAGPSELTYLPTAGTSLLLAIVITRGAGALWVRSQALAIGVSSLAVLLFALASFHALHRVKSIELYRLGLESLQADQPEAGAVFLRSALDNGREVLPSSAAYRNLIASDLSRDGKATTDIREALEQFPGTPQFLTYELIDQSVWADSSRRQLAIARLDSFRTYMTPDMRGVIGDAHHNLGVGLSGTGDRAAAIWSFRRSLLFDPGQAVTRRNLVAQLDEHGEDLLRASRFQEAADAFHSAIQLDRMVADRHHNYAVALVGLGSRKRAISSLTTAAG